jgi:hypothetical protein
MAGDEPVAVGSRRRAFNDVAAGRLDGGDYRPKLGDQEGRHPIPVRGRITGQQQEWADPGEFHVAEAEAVHLTRPGQLLIEGNRRLKIGHEHAGQYTGDVHDRPNREVSGSMPAGRAGTRPCGTTAKVAYGRLGHDLTIGPVRDTHPGSRPHTPIEDFPERGMSAHGNVGVPGRW